MKNQWRVFLGFLLVLIVVVFAVLNNQQVPVNFGFAKITGPLIVIILGSAIIGAVIGLITSTSTMWQQKKEIKKLEKDTEVYKNDISKLANEETEKVKRDYQNQLAELQAKYDAIMEKQSVEHEQDTNRVDHYTKPRSNETTNKF